MKWIHFEYWNYYAWTLYPNDNPIVAILNVGSEELKGNDTIKKAYQELNKKNNNFNFYGYVEGNQIMDGNGKMDIGKKLI